jgi:hypothetical protein
MAWLGALVVLGLMVIAADVLRERFISWRTRRRAARGLPPVVWSTRRRVATLGIGLGAVAAVLGVLLVLHGSGGSGSSLKTNRLNVIPSTTTTAPATATTTSPAAHPPQQVRVAVINASGVRNAARQKSDALRAIGYQTVGVGNGAVRTGTGVACKAGFEQDAATLAKNVGGNTAVEPFPNPPPPAAANADCVVELGK